MNGGGFPGDVTGMVHFSTTVRLLKNVLKLSHADMTMMFHHLVSDGHAEKTERKNRSGGLFSAPEVCCSKKELLHRGEMICCGLLSPSRC